MHEHQGFWPLWQKRIVRWVWIAWKSVIFAFEYAADVCIEYWAVMSNDAELFWGIGFIVMGLFGFQSGRYCDGNTAEYLSCTRPTAFYYYDGWHLVFLLIGAFLFCIWFLKHRQKHSR